MPIYAVELRRSEEAHFIVEAPNRSMAHGIAYAMVEQDGWEARSAELGGDVAQRAKSFAEIDGSYLRVDEDDSDVC